jgi:hypothetical protein
MRQEGKEPKVIDNMDSYLDLFSGARSETAIGEASPIYLGTPLAAERIKQTLPDVKLIAILRQPVEAFYSDHYMRIRDREKVDEDFRSRFKEIEKKIRSGQISGPMYYSQLKVYYDTFDPSTIRVYLYEDLVNDSRALFQDIFRFLGVDDAFVPDSSERHNIGGIPRIHALDQFLKKILKKRRVKNLPILQNALSSLQRANTVKIARLSPDLRRELTTIFRDDIVNLQKLIGRDLGHWLN